MAQEHNTISPSSALTRTYWLYMHKANNKAAALIIKDPQKRLRKQR